MTPPRRGARLGPAALLLALAPACTRPAPAPDLRVDLTLSPPHPTVGPAVVDLALTDTARRPVAGARVTVLATMSHPGMTPVIADAAEVSPGRYRAPLRLTMAGDWYFVVEAALPGGARVERTLPGPTVRPR